MTAPVRPAGTKVLGKEKWAYVPTIASTSAPVVTELTAAGSIDMSCFFFSDTEKPSVTQNGTTAPAFICDTQQYQTPDVAQWSGGNAMYGVDPQASSSANGKKAYKALPEGTTGYLVQRLGTDYDTDFAAGDYVQVYPVQFGVPSITADGEGAAALVAVKQAYFITGEPTIIAKVTAA